MIISVTDLVRVPENCEECPFLEYEFADYGSCPFTDNSVDSEEMKIRAGDCPLKEVPEDAIH